MRRTVTLTLATLALLASAVAAQAKGPEGATIEGPGLENPVYVEAGGGDSIGVSFSEFAELIGFWVLVFGVDIERDGLGPFAAAPTDELGRAYTVTWHLASARIPSTFYPGAAGGPLMYIEPDRVVSGFDIKTAGGWFAASTEVLPLFSRYRDGVGNVHEQTSTATAPTGVERKAMSRSQHDVAEREAGSVASPPSVRPEQLVGEADATPAGATALRRGVSAPEKASSRGNHMAFGILAVGILGGGASVFMRRPRRLEAS